MTARECSEPLRFCSRCGRPVTRDELASKGGGQYRTFCKDCDSRRVRGKSARPLVATTDQRYEEAVWAARRGGEIDFYEALLLLDAPSAKVMALVSQAAS